MAKRIEKAVADAAVLTGDWTERFAYDDRGRQRLHVSFEGVVTQSVHDERTGRLAEQGFFDNLTAYDNGQGTPQEVWQFTYDAFGRQLRSERTLAGGAAHITAYQYDGEGRLTRISSPEGVVSYTYDNLGRQTAVIVGTVANPERITSYTYDALGRVQTVTEDLTPANTADPTLVTTYHYDILGNLDRTDLPNGVIVDYLYDAMQRLDKLTQYQPDADPTDLSNNPKLAEYDYAVRADGKRTGVVETTWTPSGTLVNVIAWDYDAAGRLRNEDYDSSDNTRDFRATYVYDLTGNRLSYTKDIGRDGNIDETVGYTFDANDRLLQESSAAGVVTTYGFAHTQQTQKAITQTDGRQVKTTFAYDLQGRLAIGTVERFSAVNTLLSRERTAYDYDSRGIRVSALHEMDANGDGTYESTTKTEYLNDPQNFTGYSQVLQETEKDGNGNVTKRTVYAIGHDQIAQTVYDPTHPDGITSVFGTDGHGSVRILTDLAAAIVQLYAFDAYGNAIGFDPAGALTSYLYSGEQFDQRVEMQYLRERYYDPTNGRFDRFDPFFGKLNDPQSLSKYSYVHGDPVNGIDPSGLVTLPNCIAVMNARVSGTNFGIRVAFQMAKGMIGKYWNILGRYARQIALSILRRLGLSPHVEVPIGGHVADAVVQRGGLRAILEFKFSLPRGGQAFGRLVEQLLAFVPANQGQVVVWTLREPTRAALRSLERAVGQNIFNQVQFVHGVGGLWHWARFFFPF